MQWVLTCCCMEEIKRLTSPKNRLSIVSEAKEMRERVIYQNGGYRVVPIVLGYVVRGLNGQVVERFRPQEVQDAVELVDALAEDEGCFEAVA